MRRDTRASPLDPVRRVTLLGQLCAPPIASGCDLLAHDGSGLLPSLAGEFAERRPVAQIAADLLEALVRASPHQRPLALITGPVGSHKGESRDTVDLHGPRACSRLNWL